MRTIPLDVGPIHFVGIGGIGMSGIAEVLKRQGHQVQGSDLSSNPNVRRLREMGIPVAVGHTSESVGEAGVLVVSSAVPATNPEVVVARERQLPVVHRSEMLGELMHSQRSIAIAGAHGKTTTTALVAAQLEAAGLDPTVVAGGVLNAHGTNARLGVGDWLVAEADESDGSFLRLPKTMCVVTNMDREHMEFYKEFDAVRKAFESFVGGIPFYGLAVLCVDNPEVQALIPRVKDRRVLTYGLSPEADVRALDLRHSPDGVLFDIALGPKALRKAGGAGGAAQPQSRLEAVALPLLGEHNVRNALASVAVALEVGASEQSIRQALAGFQGVQRRFSRTGEAGGITVVDDYGHHPTEISAVLAAARASGRDRVIAVVQPHRFSRLRDLFDEFCGCFTEASSVIVADVYAAGEEPIVGVNRDALVEGLRRRGQADVEALSSPDALPEAVLRLAKPGDLVICFGAGSITAWARALPDGLRSIMDARGLTAPAS